MNAELKQDQDVLHVEFQECKEGVICRLIFETQQTLWATAKTRYEAYQEVLKDYLNE